MILEDSLLKNNSGLRSLFCLFDEPEHAVSEGSSMHVCMVLISWDKVLDTDPSHLPGIINYLPT